MFQIQKNSIICKYKSFDKEEFIFQINQFQEERKKVEVKKSIKSNKENDKEEVLFKRIGNKYISKATEVEQRKVEILKIASKIKKMKLKKKKKYEQEKLKKKIKNLKVIQIPIQTVLSECTDK